MLHHRIDPRFFSRESFRLYKMHELSMQTSAGMLDKFALWIPISRLSRCDSAPSLSPSIPLPEYLNLACLRTSCFDTLRDTSARFYACTSLQL